MPDPLMPELHHSAAIEPHHVELATGIEPVREALRHGPRGALLVASTTLLLLVAGWLAFYFLLFVPRGAIS